MCTTTIQQRKINPLTFWKSQHVRKFVTHLKEIFSVRVKQKTVYPDMSAMPGVSQQLRVMIRILNFFHRAGKRTSRENWEINNCNLDLLSVKERMEQKLRV